MTLKTTTRVLFRIVVLGLAWLAAPASGSTELRTAVSAKIESEYPAIERIYQDLHRHPELAFMEVKTAALEPSVFERTREALQQELANFEKRQPVGLCSYYRQLALETPRYPIEQLQVIATDVLDCHGLALCATLVATD